MTRVWFQQRFQKLDVSFIVFVLTESINYCAVKAAFHDTDILARILARMSSSVSWNAAFSTRCRFTDIKRFIDLRLAYTYISL